VWQARGPFHFVRQQLTLLGRDSVRSQVDITINLDYFNAFKSLPGGHHQSKEAFGISMTGEWPYMLIHCKARGLEPAPALGSSILGFAPSYSQKELLSRGSLVRVQHGSPPNADQLLRLQLPSKSVPRPWVPGCV